MSDQMFAVINGVRTPVMVVGGIEVPMDAIPDNCWIKNVKIVDQDDAFTEYTFDAVKPDGGTEKVRYTWTAGQTGKY